MGERYREPISACQYLSGESKAQECLESELDIDQEPQGDKRQLGYLARFE